MSISFKEEIISMITPKIKSVLRQTSFQHREDLEQELRLVVLMRLEKGFNEIPLFFELAESENLIF